MAKKPKKIELNDDANDFIGTNAREKVFGNGGDDSLSGAGGKDKLDGGEGNDTLKGGRGNDRLIGGAGDDILLGGGGDDTINASAGNDTVDGGAGDDTVVISGNYADAVVTKDGDVFKITTAAGVISVANVEAFRFADKTLTADNVVPPAEGITLTEGVDNVTGHIINAPRGFTPGGTDQVNTLNDDDTITGTAATDDALNFTYVRDVDTFDASIVPTMTGVEIVNVAVRTEDNGTLDLQDSTGIEALNVEGLDGNEYTFDNIQDAKGTLGDVGLELKISNSRAGDGAGVNFLYDDASATDDAANLTLEDATLAFVGIDDSGGDAGEGIETINLTSAGDSNSVVGLFIEDAETLNIDGSEDLALGGVTEIKGANDIIEGLIRVAGLRDVAGSLTSVDASTFTGDLDIVLGSEVISKKDGTSGVEVDFSFKGGAGNDSVTLAAGLNKGDVIDGGAGENSVRLYSSAEAGSITNIKSLIVEADTKETIKVDTSIITALADVTVRNLSKDAAVFTFDKVTATVAPAFTIQHGVTGSNGLTENTLDVNLAADTAADTVGVKIADGVNTEPRFNFTLDADSGLLATNKVENISINDADTESNTVFLTNFAEHDGTLKLTGGQDAKFLNLDSAGGGIFELDSSGAEAGDAHAGLTGGKIGSFASNGIAGDNRLVFKTIDASTFIGDSIVRIGKVDVTATFGAGDDTVIFDQVGDTRAGLTISDKVAAGDGADTLVLDGGAVANITVGASEWTNVSGFETIRLIQNDGLTTGNAGDFGDNDYNLRLTNELITANGTAVTGGRRIEIINDNNLNNETATTIGTPPVGSANSGVTIDARLLSAANSFSYDGEEGAQQTKDRFIMSDANLNGMAIINGGAMSLADLAGNSDVLEARNSSVITVGDLANVSNVGVIEFSNDTATVQQSVLELDTATIDRLVNSFHTAKAGEVEVLDIVVEGNPLLTTATTELTIEAAGVDFTKVNFTVSTSGAGSTSVVINGATGPVTFTGGAGDDTFTGTSKDDNINGGAGNDKLSGGDGADTIRGGVGTDTVTGGAGADTFVFATGDTPTPFTLATADVVTDFTTGSDKIQTQINTGILIANGAATANFAAFLANAEANNAANDVYAEFNAAGSGNAWVYVDNNLDATVNAGDTVFILNGVNLVGEISAADFLQI